MRGIRAVQLDLTAVSSQRKAVPVNAPVVLDVLVGPFGAVVVRVPQVVGTAGAVVNGVGDVRIST